MTGPTKDILANTYTWLTIFGITIPYLTIVAPVLFIKNTILPIINGILFITTVSFLLLTSFTDPGIIPRKYILEHLRRKRDQNNKVKDPVPSR